MLKEPFSGAVSLLKAPVLNLLLNICISKIGTVVQNCQFTKKAHLASCLKRFLSVQALTSRHFQQGIENCEKSRCQLYIIHVTGVVIPLALALCILFNFGTAFGRQLQVDWAQQCWGLQISWQMTLNYTELRFIYFQLVNKTLGRY